MYIFSSDRVFHRVAISDLESENYEDSSNIRPTW